MGREEGEEGGEREARGEEARGVDGGSRWPHRLAEV